MRRRRWLILRIERREWVHQPEPRPAPILVRAIGNQAARNQDNVVQFVEKLATLGYEATLGLGSDRPNWPYVAVCYQSFAKSGEGRIGGLWALLCRKQKG